MERIDTSSLVDRVYEHLLDRIITGAVKYGDSINIKKVAVELSVSTIPGARGGEAPRVRGGRQHQAPQLLQGAHSLAENDPGSVRVREALEAFAVTRSRAGKTPPR